MSNGRGTLGYLESYCAECHAQCTGDFQSRRYAADPEWRGALACSDFSLLRHRLFFMAGPARL